MNSTERNSIKNKNLLDYKLVSIYNSNPNLNLIEFKKINEKEYLYGTIKVTVNIDYKNPVNLSGKFNFLSLLIFLIT